MIFGDFLRGTGKTNNVLMKNIDWRETALYHESIISKSWRVNSLEHIKPKKTHANRFYEYKKDCFEKINVKTCVSVT